MEKQLPLVLLIVLLSFQSNLFCQNISTFTQTHKIRIQMWSLLEPDPSRQIQYSENDKFYTYSVSEIKQLAPFVFQGMLFGWNFSYTPSDKLRNVKEYFDFSAQNTLPEQDKNISYKEPWFENNRLNCWVEYLLTPTMFQRYSSQQSIVFPKISGSGKGKVSLGLDGIQTAFGQAIKNAVRTYAQSIEKNKPKEIIGKVSLTNNPRVYIDSGFYVVDLDFFLEVDRIIPYSQY